MIRTTNDCCNYYNIDLHFYGAVSNRHYRKLFQKGEEMSIRELAKQAIENSEILDTSNEAKKRTAVAFINRELIESRQYTYETLPTQEIDETIEEVLHGN